MQDSKFGITDYVVFSIVLAFSAMIGIYYRFTGGRQRTTKEYLMADKNMSVLPVAFSLMASFMSAVTLLGVSAENYVYGTQFVVINVSYIFGTFIAAFLYLPVFFKLQTTSAYEYLELRFGKPTRLIASASFTVQMVFYMSIVLYAPALALSAVTGFSKWASILSVGFVCTFYSTIGGMKAVLWTDVFQSLLMFAAILAIICKGMSEEGGLSNVWSIAEAGDRTEFFNFDPNPTVRHTFWTQMIGGIFTYTSIYGVNQAQVQRLLTVKNLRKSQLALFLNWPILTFLSLTTSLSGLVIYSKYYNCDPLKSGKIASPDQLLPLYVMEYLSYLPGLAGLCVSGVFSGALSTVSSAVNSLAAVTLEDFIRPSLSTRFQTDQSLAILTKTLACVFGLICVALTFVAERLGGVLQASLTIFGVVGGPLLGLFSLGMFCPRANQAGAIVGVLGGLLYSCWIGFGASILKPYIPVLPQSIENCTYSTNTSDFSTEATFSVSAKSIMYELTSPPNLASVSDFITSKYNETERDTFDPIDRNKDILPIYRISYMWYAPSGFIVVMVLGIATSLLFGRKGRPVTSDLLSPAFAYLFGYTSPTEAEESVNLDIKVNHIEDERDKSTFPTSAEDANGSVCQTRM